MAESTPGPHGRVRPRALEPLASRTTTGVGGNAEWLVRVDDAEQLAEAFDWAARRSLPTWILGGGSNVVISDAGLKGLVIDVGIQGLTVSRLDAGHVDVEVGAGHDWDEFVARCTREGWAGVECLSGIPGRVGATPIQNVGAYGQDVSQTLVGVQVLDCARGQLRRVDREACRFGYRTSRFKHGEGEVVVSATFRLEPGGPPRLSYPDLKKRLAAEPPPDLERVRRLVLDTRRQKSMVLDPADDNGRSCGSFFLNPTLTAAALERLRGRLDEEVPHFAQPGGGFKVPAAWLIERAGFHRGQRFGSVGISSRHSLALVCHDGATALALAGLAHRVRDGVAEGLGVELSPEPRFIGFELDPVGLPRLDGAAPGR